MKFIKILSLAAAAAGIALSGSCGSAPASDTIEDVYVAPSK